MVAEMEQLRREDAEARAAAAAAAAAAANNIILQPQPRTMMDFHTPKADDVQGPIILPEFDGEQPNLNSSLVGLVQQNCFHGMERENPHDHLQSFIQCCRTVNKKDAPDDWIRLALFPFSLRDKARVWFNSLPQGSVGT